MKQEHSKILVHSSPQQDLMRCYLYGMVQSEDTVLSFKLKDKTEVKTLSGHASASFTGIRAVTVLLLYFR